MQCKTNRLLFIKAKKPFRYDCITKLAKNRFLFGKTKKSSNFASNSANHNKDYSVVVQFQPAASFLVVGFFGLKQKYFYLFKITIQQNVTIFRS